MRSIDVARENVEAFNAGDEADPCTGALHERFE